MSNEVAGRTTTMATTVTMHPNVEYSTTTTSTMILPNMMPSSPTLVPSSEIPSNELVVKATTADDEPLSMEELMNEPLIDELPTTLAALETPTPISTTPTPISTPSTTTIPTTTTTIPTITTATTPSVPPPPQQQSAATTPAEFMKSIFEKCERGKEFLYELQNDQACCSFARPTPEATAAYDMTVVNCIRRKDLATLRSLLEEGKSFNACNRFGER